MHRAACLPVISFLSNQTSPDALCSRPVTDHCLGGLVSSYVCLQSSSPTCIDGINVCNVEQKKLINAFVIFVNVYYFNQRHISNVDAHIYM